MLRCQIYPKLDALQRATSFLEAPRRPFRVNNSHAGGHPLDVTTRQVAGIVTAVAVAQFPLVEEGHRFKTAVGMWTEVQGVMARLDRPGAEMMEQEEGVDLLYTLGGQRLVNFDAAHRHGGGGENVGDGAKSHKAVINLGC